MDKDQLLKLFNAFTANYDEKSKTDIWQKQSQIFRDFWDEKIIKETSELSDDEMDAIIRILDQNAKGNISKNSSIAKVMISQGVWRKMLDQLKNNKELANRLNDLFIETDDNKKIELVNKLYNFNKSNSNSLTGKRGNALNTFLFAHNPQDYISIVSLKHRRKVIKYFQFSDGPDFEDDSPGKKIVLSNKTIINGFKVLNINNTPKTISDFLNSPAIKSLWNKEDEYEKIPWGVGRTPKRSQAIKQNQIPKLQQQYEDYISATQVIKQGLIPWIKSIPTLTKWIKSQMEHPESSPIKVLVRGHGNGVRYYILKKSLEGISDVSTKGPLKGIVRID